MILTDGIHLVSTESLEELHYFAKVMGLERGRFHGVRKRHPHYDLPGGMYQRAKEKGATVVTTRDLFLRAFKQAKRRHVT